MQLDHVELVPVQEHLAEARAPAAARDTDMHRYLRHLTQREAEVVRLRHVEDMKMGEIGEVLGISRSSVKTLYFRALDKLRAVLAASASDPSEEPTR